VAYAVLRHNGVDIGKKGLLRSNQLDRRLTLIFLSELVALT